MDLLDHLMYQYGKIVPINIKDNKDQMDESINTSQSIGIYFKFIDDEIQFVVNYKTPYTTDNIP